MKFKTLPVLLICLGTTEAFATTGGTPEDDVVYRVFPTVAATGETPEGSIGYEKAPGTSHILFKTDQVDKLTKLFSKVKIARTSEESAPAGAGTGAGASVAGTLSDIMPDDSETTTAIRLFGPVVGGSPTAYNTLFTPKMISLFPCIPSSKAAATSLMQEINSMLISQVLFTQGQTEFGLMAQMWPTVVSLKGQSNAIIEWQNLDNAASAQNCSAAPTLVSLTLYPGTSRQATVNISPKTLGWKYAYNLFAKSQTPPLPYSSSVFLLNGDNYLVQDLVNALTAFTGSAAAVGSQLDILKAGYYQTSAMTWAGTMSSTFTAYLN